MKSMAAEIMPTMCAVSVLYGGWLHQDVPLRNLQFRRDGSGYGTIPPLGCSRSQHMRRYAHLGQWQHLRDRG